MSQSAPESGSHPLLSQAPFDGVRDYTLICLGALLVMTFVLFVEDVGWFTLLPLLIGSLSVLTMRGGGPGVTLFLFLLILGLRSVAYRYLWFQQPTSPLLVAAFAASTLVYVAAHSRLLTLRGSAIPADPRRARPVRDERISRRWLLPTKETVRSAGRVRPRELLGLLATVPLVLLLAHLIWINVSLSPDLGEQGFPPAARQALNLAWLGGVVLIIVWGLGGYLGRARASRPESALFLQDQLWNDSRGEQRQITRWVVRERLRRHRREERS